MRHCDELTGFLACHIRHLKDLTPTCTRWSGVSIFKTGQGCNFLAKLVIALLEQPNDQPAQRRTVKRDQGGNGQLIHGIFLLSLNDLSLRRFGLQSTPNRTPNRGRGGPTNVNSTICLNRLDIGHRPQPGVPAMPPHTKRPRRCATADQAQPAVDLPEMAAEIRWPVLRASLANPCTSLAAGSPPCVSRPWVCETGSSMDARLH